MLFSTAYLPPIEYFYFADKSDVFCIEICEHYQKQSYRNRASILTANGVQDLIIPVVHQSSKMMITDVQIDYKADWRKNHWKTIETAYNNTPFFLYYSDYFAPFYEKKYKFLLEYNQEITGIILKLLEIKKEVVFTKEFFTTGDTEGDLRNTIHPKKAREKEYRFRITSPYQQVFQDKMKFMPNLSVIDLLFNKGSDSLDYVRNLVFDE